jgi:peptidyl-prolyl cis-trans isomerase B (cyclophilin B)
VYGESTIPPDYPVVGICQQPAVLDRIAEAGIAPGRYGANDGAPRNPVTVQQVVSNT